MGLTPVSSHVKFTSDPDSMKKVIEENLEMGAPRLVLPFELMNTRDQVKALAETCNEMGRRCKENGLEFYYHNHFQEFVPIDGAPPSTSSLPRPTRSLSSSRWTPTGSSGPVMTRLKCSSISAPAAR